MRLFVIVAALLLIPVTAASAHMALASASPFEAGIAHPLSGLDHVAAMVAVGILAGVKGGRALWLWPLTFVGLAVLGGMLGFAHVWLPFVELGILVSAVVLSLMVTLAIAPKLWTGAALVGGFALLHGHAHGNEVAHSVYGLEFAVGFSVATLALHVVGIGLALAWKRVVATRVRRQGIPLGRRRQWPLDCVPINLRTP
ncbi:HupE/UreJ family protein [Rhizobium ruizarguesonis]